MTKNLLENKVSILIIIIKFILQLITFLDLSNYIRLRISRT